ncbi:hypothetical protein V6N13_020985 [Hibiscus sabdariffa]
MGPSYKVAVIGAGPAGLVTARELRREGHHVTVFEKANRIVVLIGSGPSAIDIIKEIAPLAKQVHQAVRTRKLQSLRMETYNNSWWHSMIECAHKDGRVVFQDGSAVDADVIIHCTGSNIGYFDSV